MAAGAQIYNVRVQEFREPELPALGAHSLDQSIDRPAAGSDFQLIYDRHAQEILRFAIRCTGRREIAEELTSEAFLRMYQLRGQIEPHRAAAWLTTTVRNLAIDHWRRQETERTNQHLLASGNSGAAPPVASKWEYLLDHPTLKPEHRACLTLHYVHGMGNKEITSFTGLTENQVKNALQYGLKLLRKAFARKETAK